MAQNQYSAPQRPFPQPLSRPPISNLPSGSEQNVRPKTRSFSFRSDRSHKGGHSHLHETPEEKEAKRLHSKADPTLAMNEAEPSAIAAGVKSSLAPLRSIQHKDALGNPIADPDKSNPTRSRWERPLDTIRSFEAAIDGGYSSRRSYVRSDSDSAMMRPRSYYPPRFPQDSYYGNGSNRRPDSVLDPNRTRERDSYMEQGSAGQYNQGQNSQNLWYRQRYSRMQTEPGPSNGGRGGEYNVYPLPNNHRSYETVASGGSGASGGGSSGAEASGYATDPTSGSDNSSIDRKGSPGKRREPAEDYGINFNTQAYQSSNLMASGGNGISQSQSFDPQPLPVNGTNYTMQHPSQSYLNPTIPRNDAPVLRKPMQISAPKVAAPQPPPPEKRKSWLSRRFSKRG